MRLEELRAAPHPDGHRIDLTWVNPDPVAFPAIRVVRRERTHPQTPDDGVVVADGTGSAAGVDARGRALHHVADVGLRGETVYYYSLFPFGGAPPEYRVERANRTASLAASPHGAAARMYELLPAIYHRYDAAAGQLRAFLELPGGQLDLLHGFARALLDAHDPARVDGRLLPLLAKWIGWKMDFRLELEAQRNEVRDAPAIFRRVGMIPVVGATVKRISGWESRSKEFVHNVIRSNQPPRLNLWARHLEGGGDTLLSLDFAFEGRPAAVEDEHGIRWLFYHTRRLGRWEVWYKTPPTFDLEPDARTALEAADAAALQRAFAAAGVSLAADAMVTAAGSLWHVDDATNAEHYVVEPGARALTAYRTSAAPLEMAPSRPLLDRRSAADDRHPAAAIQLDTLWVFWSAYDGAAGGWRIRYRTRRDGAWSQTRTFGDEAGPERRAPAVLVDPDDGLWLFWLERDGRRWSLRYNRYDPAGLAAEPPDPTAWELDPPAEFPLDGGDDPRVDADVSVLLHPDAPGRRIWVFWARQEPVAPGQTRWTVAYRVKAGIDPAVSDWSPVELLPKPDPEVHDRGPAARVSAAGDIVVYWASNREESESIWRATLDPTAAPPAWSGIERLTLSPYEQRDPLPVPLGDDTLLIFRSSESLEYPSDVYRATRTVDFRYAGGTTAHVRDTASRALRRTFGDFQAYTHETGRTDEDWYRRDTLGVYLAPDTMAPEEVERGLDRLADVLPEFMPATDRAVLIPAAELHAEFVYTYERPGTTTPRFIHESYTDALTSAVTDPGLGPDEDFTDDFE